MSDSLPRYDHPLDFLLDLLHRKQIPLGEISLAPITAEYLEYMRRAEALDINLGIEFAHTAAVLIYLKSKALLPLDPAAGPVRADPRAELIRQLLTHEQARQAAELLVEKKLLEDAIHRAPGAPAAPEKNSFSLWDLMQEFRTLARQEWSPPPVYVPENDGPSVTEMMDWLRQHLPAEPVSLTDLFSELPSRQHQSALFLALLESSRSQEVSLAQDGSFEPVLIQRNRTCLQ